MGHEVESLVEVEGRQSARTDASALPEGVAHSSDQALAYEALCKELQSERARLTAIIDGSRDAIWSWDLNGKICTWNAEAQRMFGYAPDDIIGKSVLVLIPEDQHGFAREVIGKLAQGPWGGPYETVRVRKDGMPLDVEVTVSPLRDTDGSVVGAFTVGRDITERKAVQAAMAKRATELTTLTRLTERLQSAHSPDAIYQAALRAIADALHCARASILLFDASQVMRFVEWLGLSETYRNAVDGHSPWTPDVRNPEPIYVEDIRLSGETDELKATIEAEGIRALAFIPLL